MNEVVLRNRQRLCPVHRRLFLRVSRALLTDCLHLNHATLGVHLVPPPEMTRLNENFLHHAGVTDVIAFDHREAPEGPLYGEVFICPAEACRGAKRFRTSWPEEVVRYLVHGILHLSGYDDHTPQTRRTMKREENRLLRELRQRFPLSELDRTAKLSP